MQWQCIFSFHVLDQAGIRSSDTQNSPKLSASCKLSLRLKMFVGQTGIVAVSDEPVIGWNSYLAEVKQNSISLFR